jgi:hypothetical protein
MLTIALAGLIISVILIREWMTQHNWDNQAPRTETEQPPIDPSQWRIQHGVAHPLKSVGATAEQINKELDGETDYDIARDSILRKIVDKQKHLITMGELKIFRRRMKRVLRSPDFERLDPGMTVHAVMFESDTEPLLKALLTASLVTLNDIGDHDRRIDAPEEEDEWVDEDETVQDSSVRAVAPSSQSSDKAVNPDVSIDVDHDMPDNGEGPSSPLARPCNADMEGFEKEVSYAAPELIGSQSKKGKEKALSENDVHLDSSSSVSATRVPVAIAADLGTTLQAEADASPSRSRSVSTQPSQSDGSENGELSPPAQIINMPADNVLDPPAAIVDLVVPPEVMDAMNAVEEPRPLDDGAPDFQDPDDAPLELDDWEGLLEGTCIA